MKSSNNMNAQKDENGRDSMIAILNSDGVSVTRVTANPTTRGLKVDDNTTGSDAGNNSGIAQIDENGVAVMYALSSAGDGSLVELYVDSAGKLLINSN